MHPLVAVSIFFVALGLFFSGIGVLLWGSSKLKHGEAAKAEIEAKDRQRFYERGPENAAGGRSARDAP